MADHGLAPQTVKSYLAALCSKEINLGLPDDSSLPPFHPLLKRVQAGLSRVRLQSGKGRQQVRLPISPPILRQIKAQLTAPNDPN